MIRNELGVAIRFFQQALCDFLRERELKSGLDTFKLVESAFFIFFGFHGEEVAGGEELGKSFFAEGLFERGNKARVPRFKLFVLEF